MKRIFSLLIAVAAALTLLTPTIAGAVSEQAERVESATEVLTEIMRVPEDGIPEALLSNAHGVAVIPSVLKAGFGIGGRYGKGVLVVRTEDGAWSPPTFITLAGGSVGWQIGAQATDIILVFKSKRGIEAISDGKFTLGIDASVAAGPVGRYAAATTDAQLKAEIYSYSRSRGLFAGVALDGSILQMDNDSNIAYYGSPEAHSRAIFAGRVENIPKGANRFSCTLAQFTDTAQVC
jgi:lipid-binding SYLF domain-containing protein